MRLNSTEIGLLILIVALCLRRLRLRYTYNGQFYCINGKPNKNECCQKIRSKAENSDEKPRKIINKLDDDYESISEELIANIPSFEVRFFSRFIKSYEKTESKHNAFSSILNKNPMVYPLVNSLVNEKKRTETEQSFVLVICR
ncbi:unnamed protein product [Brachionus calyciflorus]|uniref:Uncharacterized protein n=1 Tax=Brachionus calyciflorus TaxID=104777 RepID=A0A813XB80_9BILA|nr:unnamed protein product [Brachionus calyciflorus]